MEIDFIHLTDEPIISKIIFTEIKIKGTIVFEKEQPKQPTSALGHYVYSRHYDNLLGRGISIIGEVNIASLNSVIYSIYNDTFTLLLEDNEKKSLCLSIESNVAFYSKQINEVLKTLSRVAYPHIINSILQDLSHEKPTKIDSIDMYINGIRLDWNRIFKNDKILVSWNRLNYKIKNNNIVITEYNSSFIKSEISTTSKNACLMPYIIDIMKNNNPFKI